MSFGLNLTHLLTTLGMVGALLIMFILFAESGLLIGFFLPGDTLLFTAGFLATRNVFGMPIIVLVLLFAASAILGDNTGYAFGRKVGRRIFQREDSLFFHQDNLHRAEAFYERYGMPTILMARFVPIVRTFAPIVAGVGSMPYKKFLLFDVIGCSAWAASITCIGYFAGAFLDAHGIKIDDLLLPVIALAMLITLGSPLLHVLKSKQDRDRLTRQLRSIFHRTPKV